MVEQFSRIIQARNEILESRGKKGLLPVEGMTQKKKKIIGLSCGKKNGNSEILLKEAAMGAEESGVETEIIRAMEMRIKPCRGCGACTLAMVNGEVARCAIKDDDVDWILEKTAVEDCGLIVSVPVYHLRNNAYFMAIAERLLPTMFSHLEILKKTRVGAIISVGGGEPEWTSLGLATANIFVQHTRVLVDQMQLNYIGRPNDALVDEQALARARQLGRNVARAVNMPINKVTFMGEETNTSCPVCHCNLLQVFNKLPEVYCPVCWVRGIISSAGDNMKVEWNKEDIKHPRFSEYGVYQHLDFILSRRQKITVDQEKVKILAEKYSSYGKIIRP
jgi:multimeric flavodoxin WrbA